MFNSFAPTSLHLSHDQNGNPNSSPSFYNPLASIDDQTNQFDYEDIFDNYHSLINQPLYHDSTLLDFASHSSTNDQNPVFKEITTTNTVKEKYICHPLKRPHCTDFMAIMKEENRLRASSNGRCLGLNPKPPLCMPSTYQDFSCLDFATYFSANEQNHVLQEMITVGSSSKSSNDSINSSCKTQPKKLHIDEAMSERVHVGMKIALRMETKLEVVYDGYKWRKYGKKKVKSSRYPRNYYHCSTIGCKVKKRIERDTNDPSYVITTYDGVHNHEGYS